MILNYFIVMGLRGEINDGKNLLVDTYLDNINIPEGVWINDYEEISNAIKPNYKINKTFTNISNVKNNPNHFSSIEQFIKSTDKTNINAHFISNDPNVYKENDKWVEGCYVILINKMFDNSNSFIDLEYLNNTYEITDDSGWKDSPQGKYKILKYIKGTYN